MQASYRKGLLRWMMLALLAIAFAVRVFTLTSQSLWRDEVDALRFAIAPWADMLNTFTRPGWNGPLYFVLLRGWVGLTGQSEFALRYFSLIFGVLAVALGFVFARRWAGTLAAFLCSTFFAISPYFIWYSQEVKMYTLILAMAVLAIYSLRRAIESDTHKPQSLNRHPERHLHVRLRRARRAAGAVQVSEGSQIRDKEILRCAQNDTTARFNNVGWWVTLVVATSIAFYSHILAAFLIPVEMVLALVWGIGSGSHRWWRGALISFACLTLPYLPLLRWQLPLVFTPAQTGFLFYPLDQMLLVMLEVFSTGVSGMLPIEVLWPTGVLMLAGAILSDTRWRDKAMLLVWLLLPPVALFLVSHNRPIFTDRYLIWIGPAFYLLVALGAAALWRLWKPLGVAAVLAVIGIAVAGAYFQAVTPIKSDFRGAARYFDAHYSPGDLVIFQIPYTRYTFDYYYHKPYDWAEGLFTNYGMSDAEVDAQMREIVKGHKTVWLVASEMEMWDSKLQVWKWLESHARRTDTVELAQVVLYRYEF